MSEENKQPLINFELGAEGGYKPDLDEWISEQDFIPRNLLPVIVRYFPEELQDHSRNEVVKRLIEFYPIQIVGMKSGIILDTDTGAIHNQVSVPEFLFARSEIYGRAIENFFTEWTQDVQARAYGFKDQGEEVFQKKLGPASIDMMLIEPDPTYTMVITAWHCKNFHPRSVEGVPGRRDLTAIAEVEKVKVKFEASIEVGHGVNQVAQTYLNGLLLESSNPFTRKSFLDAIKKDLENK
ncbi:MAG: hypothetical protein P4L77_10605 [Sulfuriferula sp.]|nr:hypothetical protein [Sulfuriferula sp.]